MSVLDRILGGETGKEQRIRYEVEKTFTDDPVEESLSVDNNTWSCRIERKMGDDFEVLDKGHIDLNTQEEVNFNKREHNNYYALPGELPCSIDFYEGDICSESRPESFEEKAECFNSTNSHPCGVDGMLFDKDYQLVEDVLSMTGLRLARYYSNTLDFFRSKPGNVSSRKTVLIDENLSQEEIRCVRYDRSDELREIKENYDEWDLAQKCDKMRTEWKKDSNFDAPIGTAISCFDSDNRGWGMFTFHLNELRYNESLVGSKEPEKPVATLERVGACDVGLDGDADSASAEWFETSGKFTVAKRSSYTESMLAYFDRFFDNVKDDSYYIRLDSVPLEVNIKEMDIVQPGQNIFSYATNDGSAKTYKAEGSGFISNLYRWNEGVIVEIESTDKYIAESVRRFFDDLTTTIIAKK